MSSIPQRIALASKDNLKEWNQYVENHPDATPYHRLDWLLSVEAAYRQSMMGAIAYNEQGKVIGVFPAVLFKGLSQKKNLCALPYCDLGFGLADNVDIQKALQIYLIQQAKSNGSQRFEIRAKASSNTEESELIGQKVRMLLALPQSGEDLMNSFKSKLRSQIRKAEKNGLSFHIAKDTQSVKDFYLVYATNMRDLGSPAHHFRWFEQILAHYGDNAVLSIVYKDEQPAGAGIVLKNANKACIPWASTLRDFNRLAPNMLLYWSLLEHCADNNVTEFDFGRSTYNEGTYKFKKQWGALPQMLDWQTVDNNNEVIRGDAPQGEKSKIRQIVESLWPKLPLGLSVSLGTKIRPYISL